MTSSAPSCSFPDKARIHLGYGFVGFKEGGRVALFEKVQTASDATDGADADVQPSTSELLEAPFDLLVGADGVSSSVRTQLLKTEEAEGAPAGEWCEVQFSLLVLRLIFCQVCSASAAFTPTITSSLLRNV